jgi:hypothetical protein
MGGHPYWYYVPYREDLQRALDELRLREFRAGRYSPVIPILKGFGTPVFVAENAGAAHASIAEAIEAAGEEGTCSILDIQRIGTRAECGVAAPFDDDQLVDFFATTQPTHEIVEANPQFFEDIGRGCCVYIVLYSEGKPTEILFAGYSFD